jgi:elongation factor Ts
MADITAKLVNDLRAKTGLGMMECKKALTEANGNLDTAIDNLRKKGVKASITERAASEGRVGVKTSPDGKRSAIVEILCNTDFTAKSDPVASTLAKALDLLLANPDTNVAESAEIKSVVTATAQQTGENVQVGRSAVISNPAGRAGAYLYAISSKIGVLVSLSGNTANVTDELLIDLGGHIAFARPLALSREGLPADLVAKEREIAVEQAKATGKPQQIAEKIAEGKLNSFFAERALLDQEFFNAQKYKGSIGKMLEAKGLKLEKYVRVEVGQQ